MSNVIARIESRMAHLRNLVGETASKPTQQFSAELNQAQAETTTPEAAPTFSAPAAGETLLAPPATGESLLSQPAPASADPASHARRSTRSTPEALQPIIQEAASRTGLAPELIDAVIKAESGYRTNAVSRVGAQGLMQLMPGTARSLGVSNPFDARQNVMGGAEYLSKQISRFGSVEKALAAYNAGPGAVQKFGGVPPYAETQRYVRKIMADVGSAANSKGEAQ